LLLQSNLKIVAEILIDENQENAEGEQEVNRSRCIAIAKTAASASGDDKSCIAFGTKNQSGALHRALGVFHSHGVNLTSIESLPSAEAAKAGGSASFTYDFFVELEGSLEGEAVRKALEALKEETTFVLQFGSYARGDQHREPDGASQVKKQRTS